MGAADGAIRQQVADLESLLCATLQARKMPCSVAIILINAHTQNTGTFKMHICTHTQSLIRKVTSQDALSIADTVMTALLMMFTSASGQIGGVQEDAIMTVSVLVEGVWRGMYVICLKWCGVGCVEGDVCNLPEVVWSGVCGRGCM